MIRSRRIRALAASTAVVAVCAPAGVARGQTAPPAKREIELTVVGGYEQAFDTDIDEGGEVEVSRARFGLGAQTDLDANLKLSLSLNYELAQYDFSGTTSFGAEPWEDIHTLGFGAQLRWSMTNDWTIFGGPIIQFSRESDADWDDALTGGAVFGASHVLREGLVIGGGLGVVSQIEDDVLVFPVLILDWQLSESLRLTTQSRSGAGWAAGLELAYDLGGGWEAGIGARYEYRRFRLDDDGPAPDGVGEDKSLPIWGRVSHRFSENFSVDIYGGVRAAGELDLEDKSGDGVTDSDYDAAPFGGVSVRIRF
ncbi:MAG: outer membrane beta-barrel protein [Planctomycetota bacterium]